MRESLAARILGQELAIEAGVSALERRHRLPRAAAEKRPIWTALFAGSSGIGKTEMASAIGEEFFGTNNAVCTIDCSELTQEHHAARLVGAPPGYVGYGKPGQLVSALERRANGLILFDEVEKAHPQILTSILLPLLGEGVLHDMSSGRVLNATDWILVLTSNLGTNTQRSKTVGFQTSDSNRSLIQEDSIRSAIEDYLPRELLGRVDDIVVFEQLGPETVRRIWERETASLEERLRLRGEPVRLDISDAARDLLLAHAGPAVERQGARALKRLFNKAVVDRCLSLLTEPVLFPSVLRIEAVDPGLRYQLLPEDDAETLNGKEP
jgi:ATP-dependent Clp protease ATP-binding subunit ClpC